jgi:hypothetical protein
MNATIKGQNVPLKMPAVCDRLGLLAAYSQHQKKPAALARLRMAALGIGLGDSVAAKFEDYEFDLLKYGSAVAAELANEPEQIQLYATGEMFLTEIFSSLAPTKAQAEAAENF